MRIGISGSSTNDGSVSPITFPLSALRAGPLGPAHCSAGYPPRDARSRFQQQLSREHGCTNRAGALAELGGHDRDRRPVLRTFDVSAKRVLQRPEQKIAEFDETAGD